MDVVITTIFPPTEGAIALSNGLAEQGGRLWVVGDRKGPVDYNLPAVEFFPIQQQLDLDFELGRMLQERSYARKNLGYLLAMAGDAPCIVETDDDNIPLESFWDKREQAPLAFSVEHQGWLNVYRVFSSARIWPRGFPLEALQTSWSDHQKVGGELLSRPSYIQQGLANENPDVDAVYRLVAELPIDFENHEPVFLGEGVWCPFNSQNTTFFPPAYPLMYLPTFCSFRMTDIWRSFVAQRCLWAMGSGVLFTEATVYQRRNEHSLLRDFEDEVSGYLKNDQIRDVLQRLVLRDGIDRQVVSENLLACYAALVGEGIFPESEMPLVEAWVRDLNRTGAPACASAD